MRSIAAAVAAALAAAAFVAGCGGAGAGPFAPLAGNRAGNWAPVSAGQTAAMTIVMPRRLNAPAVLLDVHPLHKEDADGLRLRYAATTGMGLELAGQHGWNRPGWQERPLAGFVIPAHVVGGVTIGAASVEPGYHFIRDFVLDYRVGSTRYSAPMPIGFGLCVGMSTCANAPKEG